LFDSDIREVPNMLKGVKAKPTEAICERKVKVLWLGYAGVGCRTTKGGGRDTRYVDGQARG
jgi:hypothetical protein